MSTRPPPESLVAECEAVYAMIRDAAARRDRLPSYRTMFNALKPTRGTEVLVKRLRERGLILMEFHPELDKHRRVYVPEVDAWTLWTAPDERDLTRPRSGMRDPDRWLAKVMAELAAAGKPCRYEDVADEAPEIGPRMSGVIRGHVMTQSSAAL